jgi:hypothetical protein
MGYRLRGRSLSRGYSRGWTLPNRCKRVIGRNFCAGCIDVVNVSDTLPDNVGPTRGFQCKNSLSHKVSIGCRFLEG